MSKWAPIVVASTYEVDFRPIALPSFLAQAHLSRWALDHINASMYRAEKLITGPRWMVFQNDKCRVVGVTCLVRDIVGEQDLMTRDKDCRSLYAFVGFASLRGANGLFPAIPLYTASLTPNQAPFAGLYDLVRQHWNDTRAKPPDSFPPTVDALATSWWRHHIYSEWMRSRIKISNRRSLKGKPKRSSKHRTSWRHTLNDDLHKVAVWQDSLVARGALWRAISVLNRPTSLCLAFATREDAQRSPFMNATVIGLKERSERIERTS